MERLFINCSIFICSCTFDWAWVFIRAFFLWTIIFVICYIPPTSFELEGSGRNYFFNVSITINTFFERICRHLLQDLKHFIALITFVFIQRHSFRSFKNSSEQHRHSVHLTSNIVITYFFSYVNRKKIFFNKLFQIPGKPHWSQVLPWSLRLPPPLVVRNEEMLQIAWYFPFHPGRRLPHHR